MKSWLDLSGGDVKLHGVVNLDGWATYLLAIVYMCQEIQDILEAGLHTADTENLVLYKKKKKNEWSKID